MRDEGDEEEGRRRAGPSSCARGREPAPAVASEGRCMPPTPPPPRAPVPHPSPALVRRPRPGACHIGARQRPRCRVLRERRPAKRVGPDADGRGRGRALHPAPHNSPAPPPTDASSTTTVRARRRSMSGWEERGRRRDGARRKTSGKSAGRVPPKNLRHCVTNPPWPRLEAARALAHACCTRVKRWMVCQCVANMVGGAVLGGRKKPRAEQATWPSRSCLPHNPPSRPFTVVLF